jgi:hypothetical protein
VSPRPLVFISAASAELKSARQLVANTLTFLGYEPTAKNRIAAKFCLTAEGDRESGPLVRATTRKDDL